MRTTSNKIISYGCLIILSFFLSHIVYAQQSQKTFIALDWAENPVVHHPNGANPIEIFSFKDAIYGEKAPSVPAFLKVIELDKYGEIQATLNAVVTEPLEINAANFRGEVLDDFQIETSVEQDRQQYLGKVTIIPIRKKGNTYEKLVSATLNIQITPTSVSTFRGPTNTTISELSEGTIYKIGVSATGMHQMTFDFLKDEVGMNIESIDPRQIRLLGAGGGVLPEVVATERVDDLKEIPILVTGESDGSFDSSDKIIFFAEGVDEWSYDTSAEQFTHKKNIYDTQNYYFIKIDGTNGQRISSQSSISTTDYTSTAFDDMIHYEEDRVNLLHDYALGQGSGQEWYGDLLEVVREQTYDVFNFPNIINSEPAIIKSRLVGRSEASSRMKTFVNGMEFTSGNISFVDTGESESVHAYEGEINDTFTPSSDNLPVTIRYEENSTASRGWVDYVEVQARRTLRMVDNELMFRDVKSTAYSSTTFVLDNVNANTLVWDVTNPLFPIQLEGNVSQNQLAFGVETNVLKEFIAFQNNIEYPIPTSVGEIPNQNLHGLDDMDMILIYPSIFENEATQLAQHRKDHSGLDVEMVLVDDIYNEFSSGRLDPTAIRDFLKMLHDRSPKLKYVLLFGDGSFDAREIYTFESKSNHIPVYETVQSLAPIKAFPSDDYFVLLSDNEGINLAGSVDLAVGRLPVKTNAEAQGVVNKIIKYDTNPKMQGDWRNRLLFIADDEDDDRHMRDSDGIAEYVDTTYNQFNVDKIYLDAYRQVSTPGGEKYPEVTEAINKAMFQGVLVMNYLGHGGSKGWTQERVLNLQDIEGWSNTDHNPLLVTATCSFSGYDDPAFTTAGERTLIRENGGSIGLFTTVRAVFSTSNERLTRAAFEQLFVPNEDGIYPALGEILRLAKNTNTSSGFTENSRKFTLLGDPSMNLALPRYNVATTSINDNVVTAVSSDTLRALQRVTITGHVEDDNGTIISDFNGQVFPTIFDKEITIKTLGQDEGSNEVSFTIQENIIFKGAASVVDGTFEFTFVVPKDINYTFGNGKISYYAQDGERDANGSYENIVIGGTDEDITNDDEGPLVEVFMNNEDFVFGGITDENPVLFVKLEDDNGINVAGNSVGHDLTGILDEDSQNTYLLNDFYEAELDDYTKGVVRFPLFDIEPGRHSIRVKAWDVSNNSSEGSTEFVVAESAVAALEQVLNYPNPFSTNTNFQFEHNLSDQVLNVDIRIYSITGVLVKTIEEQLPSDGFRVKAIQWDGRGDNGDDLARGIYVYKVKLGSGVEGSDNFIVESDLEKLVIIK